jgi:hypothetical protein
VDNPFALLTALRRNASRISLYCHAGATKVPARHVALLTFLEDSVHPVTPPRRGGVFHPKLWVLRFAPQEDGEPVQYRLLVLSRNLTFDRSWDIALQLDGVLAERMRGFSGNRPLSDFIAALPGMARSAGSMLTTAAEQRAALLSEEVRRVEWWLPEGIDEIGFHAIGHDGRPNWPIVDFGRLMVISPFLGPGAVDRLAAEADSQLSVISRFESLTQFPEPAFEAEVFDDPAALLDAADGAPDETAAQSEGLDEVELSGLHAKIYVGERGRRASVFVGSANATEAAFEHNVEFLVELDGGRAANGIDAIRTGLRDAGLLRPFEPGTAAEVDEAGEALERRLERLAHELGSGALTAHVEEVAPDRWKPSLRVSDRVAPGDFEVEARPLYEPTFRRVRFDETPCAEFPTTGLASISAFFALRITGRASSGKRTIDVVVRVPLHGAPSGRVEAVTADLLSDRERLLRFILLLLADHGDSDRMLDELEALFAEEHSGGTSRGQRNGGAIGLPLLEPMLRALHRDPDRLAEIDQLLSDIRNAGGSTADLLPPDLEALWETVSLVRKERT